MKKFPTISVIIVTANNKEHLKKCLNSISKTDYPKKKIETIVITDVNDSQKKLETFIKKSYKKTYVIKTDKYNYSYSNNLGIKKSKGEFVLVLNDDVQIDKQCLKELTKVIMKDKKIGGVSPKILFEDGRINWTGHEEHPNFYFGEIGFNEEDKGQHNQIRKVSSLCNATALYRKKFLQDVGYLDEDFNMYYEDIDLGIICRKKGWDLFYVPNGIAYHKYHGTISLENFKYYTERGRLLYVAKHWPDELPKAVVTSHLFYKDIMHEHQLLFNILSDAIGKLIKHHDKETIGRVMPMLLNELNRVIKFENHDFLKTAKDYKEELENTKKEFENKIESTKEELNSRLESSKEELNSTKELFYITSKRLKGFYNSRGYKYILVPLWKIVNLFKKS